jgi:hypothetical protein
MSSLCKNVFEAILKYGHDEDSTQSSITTFCQRTLPLVHKKRSKSFVVASSLGSLCGTRMTVLITADSPALFALASNFAFANRRPPLIGVRRKFKASNLGKPRFFYALVSTGDRHQHESIELAVQEVFTIAPAQFSLNR